MTDLITLHRQVEHDRALVDGMIEMHRAARAAMDKSLADARDVLVRNIEALALAERLTLATLGRNP